MDQQAQTPMNDHVARFWKLLEEGKVRILVDSWCAGFGGHGWYETSSFGDDVAKALIADRYFEYMKLWEAPVKAKKE